MRSRITHRVACDRGIPSQVSRKHLPAVGPILFTSVLLVCLSLLQGCSTPSSETRGPEQNANRMSRFSVLTYNTLHALEVGRYSVRPGESEEARAARLALQIKNMTTAAPDIILLQEVNPLPDLSLIHI